MDNATPDVDNLEKETEHLENVNKQTQELSDEMQLKAYINELEKQNKELTDKNADNNNKIQQMTEQLHNNDIEIQALTNDKTRLNDTVEKARQSYVQLEEKFDQLDEQLTNAYKAKAECKADLETIENQLQNKIDELQTLRSSEVKALEGQIKELEDKLNQENVELAVIDISYTTEKDKMVAEFDRTDLDPMRNEFNNISIEKVNRENELKEEIAKLYEIKYQLEDYKNQLEQQLRKNEDEIKKLTAIKGNLQSALENRNLQINQFKTDLFTYAENCIQHGEENKYLREKNVLLEKELNARCNENNNLKNSLSAISSELDREREATKTKSQLITELYDKNRNLAKESAQNEWNARIIEKLNLEIKKMDKENAQVLNEILVGNSAENFKLSNEDVKATGTDEIISYPKTTPSLMKTHSSHNSRHLTSQQPQSYSPEPLNLNQPHNLHIGPKSFLPSVDSTRPLQKSPINITGPLAHPISDHPINKVYSPVQFYAQPYFTSPNYNPGLIPPQQTQANTAAQHFGQQDQQAYDPNQYPTRMNNETEQASYLIHPQSYANDPTRQYATLPPLNDQTQCQPNYNPEQSTNYDQISQRQQNMQSKIDYKHKLTNPKSVCQICAKEFANESEMDNHIVNCCVTPLNLSKHPHDHRYYTMPQATSMDNLCSTKSVPSTRYSAGDSHMPTSRSNSEFAGNSCKFSESEHVGVLKSTYFNSSSTSESKVQVMLLWKKSVITAKREIIYFDEIDDSISLKLDNKNETFQTNLNLQPGRHKGTLAIEDIDYMLEVNEFEVSKLKSASNTVQVIHLNTTAPGMMGWNKQDQFEGKKV